jgi:hypothetical protein
MVPTAAPRFAFWECNILAGAAQLMRRDTRMRLEGDEMRLERS